MIFKLESGIYVYNATNNLETYKDILYGTVYIAGKVGALASTNINIKFGRHNYCYCYSR